MSSLNFKPSDLIREVYDDGFFINTLGIDKKNVAEFLLSAVSWTRPARSQIRNHRSHHSYHAWPPKNRFPGPKNGKMDQKPDFSFFGYWTYFELSAD